MVSSVEGSEARLAAARRRWMRQVLGGTAIAALAACGGGDTSGPPDDGKAKPLALAAPSQGRWSPVVDLSLVPAAAALVPGGKVLFWSAETRFSFSAGGRTYTTLFDPATQTAAETLVSNTGHNMFCPGTSQLPDGRLLVSGGIDAAATSLYDPVTNNWSAAQPMNIPRGYQANSVLEDGSVFTLGGSWSGGVGGKHGEVWTPEQGWRRLSGVLVTPMLSVDPSSNSSFGGDSHFWLFPAGNGKVFHAGPGMQMNWISTAGEGGVVPAGSRGDDEFSVNGTVAMYDVGRILKTGGAPAYEDRNANANSYVIEINAGASVRKLAPMAYPRAYHNSVVLPNGQVMLVGGMTFAKNFTDNTAVLRPELFDPATESFTLLPPMAVPRTYHSVALLLPDARVLSAGGGLCGVGCAANHPDLQIYTPNYLLNEDGTDAARPVIVTAPAVATHGTRVTATVDRTVTAFSLVRFSAVTHSVNNDQRRIPLSFVAGPGNAYELTIPSNPGVVVPGNYMLFAMDANGVPSVAKMVRITGTGAPKLTNPGDVSTALNAPVSLAVGATGATGFTANGLPPGLTIDPVTGTISGLASQVGRFVVTVVASNATAQTSTSFVWTVGAQTATARYFRLEALSEVQGGPWSSVAELHLLDATGTPLPRTGWLATADSAETGGATPSATGIAAHAIDGDPATIWQTQWISSSPPLPHWLSIDTGGTRTVGGFRYLPRRDGSLQGTIATWRMLASDNGVNWTVVATGSFSGGTADAERIVLFGLSGSGNRPPDVAALPNQSHSTGQSVSLAVTASDPDGDVLSYAAYGLPPGIGMDARTGLLTGAGQVAGVYTVTVEVNDGRGGTSSRTFTWTIVSAGFALDPVPAPPVAEGSTVTFTASASGGSGVTYSWSFGDGSPVTAPSTNATAVHGYAAAGMYTVTLTATDASGAVRTRTFLQAVHAAPVGTARPTRSSTVAVDASGRVWLVNQDNDSVSIFDGATATRLREVTVGASPRSVAVAPDGRVWVANKVSSSISIVDPSSFAVVQTVALPRGSQPHGLAFTPDGAAAYLALEATGRLLRLHPTSGATLATVGVGPNPRHVAVTAASDRVLVSRFITPPQPGEATATVGTESGGQPQGGELVVVTASGVVERTVVLRHSDRPDTSLQGGGVPNYLGAPAIAPDGRSAWVPSKQDNLRRGTLRSGVDLDFQNTVRAVSSRVDLVAGLEDPALRIDHDNAGLASAAVFHPTGAYLFVALQTSRQVAVVDPIGRTELFRFDAGRAPDGLAISADGKRLFVDNFMDRTVGVYDLSRLVGYGEPLALAVASVPAVTTERLDATVLRGKRLFYDARDPRLARDGYLSCAACHNDGGEDGRVWDMTGAGEGLRNTISLRGRGNGHGRRHWTGNFDEVQDFEAQIRRLAGGTGLMTDADYLAGTRSQPLGDPKAGLSADLDALAAYVASLTSFAPSPYRPAAASLSSAALEGKLVFTRFDCAACHAGTPYTNSPNNVLRDIGTIKPSSGKRLGAPLTGLDVPTLRDVWATAPYLHDGSAATLEAAVLAHSGLGIGAADAARLAAYLREIGGDEAAAPLPGSIGTIWPPTAAPALLSDNDPTATTLGTKFRSDLDGFITAVRFYKGPANTGTHVGGLWTAAGQQLATVTFTNETASGWQQANFATPVAITANTVYVVGYHAPNGQYPGDDDYFAVAGFDNPPLHALREGDSGPNGVWRYGSTLAFPDQPWRAENYWVDVVFTTSVVDTTAPSVTGVSPTSGASGVPVGSAVSATFSEAIDAATLGSSTFELRHATTGVAVAATVGYDAAARVVTLAPAAPLAAGAPYTATLRGGTADPRVKDLAGNALAASVSWTFTTSVPDTTPPTITSRSPSPDATGVSRTTTVAIVFSEAIDPATVAATTFELRTANGPVTATVGYDAGTRTVTIVPAAILAASSVHTVTVRGGAADPRVKDVAGNALASSSSWNFTTVAGDTVPPSVSSTSPAAGAAGVSRTANITATFSEAMDATTVTAASFELHAPDGSLVAAAVSYSATNRRATLDPTPTLAAGKTYTAIVRGGTIGSAVADVAGNRMAADRVWTFTTVADTTPPSVSSTSPAAGATGVSRTANVTVTFSEDMDPASISAATIQLLAPGGAVVPAVVSYASTNRRATLNPDPTLSSLTTYSVIVRGGSTEPRVKDVAGNALAADQVWSFTTRQ